MKRLSFLALGVLVVAACSDDPVDVEGTYAVGLTNRDNGCNFQNWTVGAQTTGVEVVITQNGANAIAEVKGLAGGYLSFAFGSSTFSGSVDGDALDLSLSGTRPQTSGNCTYTYDGRIQATLSGNALNGSLTYASNGNDNTDCAAIVCTSVQDFAGSRPPK
ncbi:MAG TPA: hypothetical protein VL326_34555 [Kofleriaceae bacterium]|jgi:hypothetical protein|nr:hypothetical protein [Kofleriaceae bacterium]